MKTLLKGLVIGWLATEALDRLSILLYESQSAADKEREDRARGRLHAYEVAVDRMARRAGLELSRERIGAWGWRFHKAFGLAGGILYSRLRRRFPAVGALGGLAFGTAFFVLVDELLMPLLRLTPGPRAFSWKVHARGAVSHLAYGVVAETAARRIDKLAS